MPERFSPVPELGWDCWGEGLSGLEDLAASDVFYLPPPETIIDAISLDEVLAAACWVDGEAPPATIHY